MSSKEVCVSISIGKETYKVGRLWFNHSKGRESASFEYTRAWLRHPERFALEPALKLGTGVFHTRRGMSVFGAIGDSAPDRWGRMLMRRAAIAKAEQENTKASTLFESDYLLGVNDEARQGSLRFSLPQKADVYLAPQETATPSLINLPKLLSATARYIENDESFDDLRLLLVPGSSLGGARPKASVRDRDGSLAIAKFPNKTDEYDVVIWEAVALVLAEQAGITVPQWRLERVVNQPVLIVRRFDRNAEQRIPFLSAMGMLDAQDNEQHSYLEIAYALAQHGAAPEKDMAELWRRIIFTIMIANTDDHLRNHGFIYERYKGWRLSPIYDINPTPIEVHPRVLTTAIDFDDTRANLDVAMSVASEFKLTHSEAKTIVSEVSHAVKNWRNTATRYGLTQQACEQMASAFEYRK